MSTQNKPEKPTLPAITTDLSTVGMWLQGWHLIKGSKASIWGVSFVGVIINVLLFSLASVPAMRIVNEWDHLSVTMRAACIAVSIAFSIATLVLTANLLTLLLMLGIKRARGEDISFEKVKPYLSRWLPITLSFICIAIFNAIVNRVINIGLLSLFPALVVHPSSGMLTHPNIGAAVFMLLVNMLLAAALVPFFLSALPLVAERKYSAWQGFVTSLSLGKRNWFRLFILLLMIQILYVIPLLAMAVPYIWPVLNVILMIWFIPYAIIVFGIGYVYIASYDPILRPPKPTPKTLDNT